MSSQQRNIVDEIMGMNEEAAVATIDGLTEVEFSQLLSKAEELSQPIAQEVWRVASQRAGS